MGTHQAPKATNHRPENHTVRRATEPASAPVAKALADIGTTMDIRPTKYGGNAPLATVRADASTATVRDTCKIKIETPPDTY